MMTQTDNMIDVHAIAHTTSGNYDMKLVDLPPDDLTAYAKVIEPIEDGRQLVLWVPEGTPGETAQNLATHFAAELRTRQQSDLSY
jgi:hypothetical protein